MTISPPGARLRALMDDHTVSMPGAFNALVARAIARTGFEACYVSGGATSVAAGVPDVGLLTLDHFTRIVREVADASGLPVLADADTGFGEAELVRRTVIEYARAGAGGLHLEDQVFPKRCGHLDNKTLVPVEHAAEKIQWASSAAHAIGDGSFIICARTDAAAVEGLDAAIARSRVYLDAGADMLFPEGLHTEADFAAFAEAIRSSHPRAYLLANMTEFGKTPMLPVARFAELGYHCVIFPVSMLRIAMGAVTRALRVLHEEGSVASVLSEMQTRQELYDLIDYTPGKPWEYPVRS